MFNTAPRLYSIKEITKLEKRRFRDEEGVFLIEGKKILEEAKKTGVEIRQILVTDKFLREQKEFLKSTSIDQRELTTIADHNAQRLSSTEAPQGIFAVCNKPKVEFEDLIKGDLVVACDNIRDPGNFGTMIRTADWFGVKAIITSSTNVDPYNDKVIRSSMGSLFHLKIYVSSDLESDLRELKKESFIIVSTRPEAKQTAAEFLQRKIPKVCLVMGNESTGTSPEIDAVADTEIAIPKYGQAESLNVAVSFGILLNELVSETGK
jgi:TrmH family RNA methyltransferase